MSADRESLIAARAPDAPPPDAADARDPLVRLRRRRTLRRDGEWKFFFVFGALLAWLLLLGYALFLYFNISFSVGA